MNLKGLLGGLKTKQCKVPVVVPRNASLAIDAKPTAKEDNAFDEHIDVLVLPHETGPGVTNQVSSRRVQITNFATKGRAELPVLFQPKPCRWDAHPPWVNDTGFNPALFPIAKPAADIVDFATQPTLYPLTQRLYSQVIWYPIEVANWPPFRSTQCFDPFEDNKGEDRPNAPSHATSPKLAEFSPGSSRDELPAVTTPIDEVSPSSTCDHDAYGAPHPDNEYARKSTATRLETRYGPPKGPWPRPETRGERERRLAAAGYPPGLPPPRKRAPTTFDSNSLAILSETREERARRLKDVEPPLGLPPLRRSVAAAPFASADEMCKDRERPLAAVGPPPDLPPPRRRVPTTFDFTLVGVAPKTRKERALRVTDASPPPGLSTPPARRSIAMNARSAARQETPEEHARRLKDIGPPPGLPSPRTREQVVSEFGVGGRDSSACVRRRGAKSYYQ